MEQQGEESEMNLEDLDRYCPRGLNKSLLTEAQYRTAAFNDTCLEGFFFQLQTSLRRFNEWEEVIYTSIYVIISVLAVIGNGLVIVAVIRKKSMRTNRNVLIMNLALSNLVLAFTNIPFLWLPSIDFEFPYSRFFCKFANVLPGSNIYCSTFTISVMAIDRYYSVKNLKLVSARRKCAHAVFASLIIWLMSFILSLPLLIYYDTSMLYVVKDVIVLDESGSTKLRSYGWRQCRLAPSRSSLEMSTQKIQLLMSVLQVAFLYIVPLFVLATFNMKLTRFLKLNTNQMSRNRVPTGSQRQAGETKRNTEAGQCLVTIRSTSTPSIRSSIAERASERRTSRTTSLLTAMAGSYAVLWLPFTLVSLLLDLDILYNDSYVAVIERIDQTCKMVSMLSICVNPFLYGFLNTNFRHEFTEIYYTWLLCNEKAVQNRRFVPELSSMAVGTRRCSYQKSAETDSGLFSTFRRSFQGPIRKLQSSFKSDVVSNVPAKSCARVAVGQSSSGTVQSSSEDLNRDRIFLDADSMKDSFV